VLILSRRAGEEIVIQVPGRPDIVVAVVQFTGPGQVRIGVAATPDVTVHRREVAERIYREGIRDGTE
jgi:carbon storage regulator CsrA